MFVAPVAFVVAMGYFLAPVAVAVDAPRVSDAALRAEAAEQWSDAVRLHSEQLAAEPARADLWVRIADIEVKRGNTNGAVAALKSATQADPSDSALFARLSQALSIANEPVQALQAVEEALDLAPANMDYLRARAELANWIGRPGIAADSYRRMLDLRPGDAPLLLLLARARTWSGDLDRASDDYARYVDQNPDDSGPLMEYARVESWRGDFGHAIELLDRYGEKFGDLKQVWKEKARVLASADRPRAAMQANDPLLAMDPQDFELQFTRSVALHFGNRPYDAVESVKELERGRPDSAENESIRRFIEAPLRPDVKAYFRFYEDRDDLQVMHWELSADVPVHKQTRVRAGIELDELYAELGSGLENIRGIRSARHSKEWIGLQHYFTPSLWGDANIGYADVPDKGGLFAYALQVGARPVDSLRLNAAVDRDFVTVSPRSVSLGVERQTVQGEVQWQPDFLYTVIGSGRYDDYNDGNERWGLVVAPRRSVLRNSNLNIDLGVRGNWFGFSENLDSGYYDPASYQQYVGTAFMYWKLTPESGVNLIMAAGAFKDNSMKSFDFGWSADVDVAVGAYSDWMLKVSGHVIDNFKQYASEAFGAVAASISITRRF